MEIKPLRSGLFNSLRYGMILDHGWSTNFVQLLYSSRRKTGNQTGGKRVPTKTRLHVDELLRGRGSENMKQCSIMSKVKSCFHVLVRQKGKSKKYMEEKAIIKTKWFPKMVLDIQNRKQ